MLLAIRRRLSQQLALTFTSPELKTLDPALISTRAMFVGPFLPWWLDKALH